MAGRRLAPLAAALAAVISISALAIEVQLERVWESVRTVPLAYMWTARWIDLLAQAMILMAVVVAVTHMLREVIGPWRSSTPTR